MADVEPIILLDEFVATTILQILGGVATARKSAGADASVAPKFKMLGSGDYVRPIYVQFDVQVTVKAGSEAEADRKSVV